MKKQRYFAKCDKCGKFVGMKDEYVVEFTPDTEFTVEALITTHKKCYTT